MPSRRLIGNKRSIGGDHTGRSHRPRRKSSPIAARADKMCPMTKTAAFALLLAIAVIGAPWSHADDAPAIPKVKLERVIPKMDNPVYLLTDPNGRMLIVEKTGRVRIIRDDFTVEPQPYLD